MKRVFTLVMFLALFFVLSFPSASQANPISKIGRQTAEADLKADLMQRYGTSYTTIEMLLNSGMKAYDEMCEMWSTIEEERILEDLIKRYYPHFSTIQMLYKSNREAYKRLNR